MDQEKIGKNILDIRKKNHLSQSQFATRLGVTSQAVSKWENGRGIPDIGILLRIKEEFQIDIDEIITGSKKRKFPHNWFYIFLISIIIVFCIVGIFHLKQMKFMENYKMGSISSIKDEFSIRGIFVQHKDSISIYISNIVCNEKFHDEKKFIAVESVLYEDLNDNYKIIATYGDINEVQNKEANYLMDLLNNIEFKVNNLEDNYININESNYFILINALASTKEVISYRIPLYLVME